MSNAEEPLSLTEKLLFFFLSVLVKTIGYGAQYKALGYVKKERQKWHYIYAGIIFYILVVCISAKLLAFQQGL